MKKIKLVGLVVTTLALSVSLAGAQGLFRAQEAAGAVEVQVYSADPEQGGELLQTLTVDHDPRALRETVADIEAAAFIVVKGENFSRTIDLSEVDLDMARSHSRFGRMQGHGMRFAGPPAGARNRMARGAIAGGHFGGDFSDQAEVTLTFYDAHPDEGGSALGMLQFAPGQDDREAFQAQFDELAADAAYLQVDTEGRVIDLSKRR